MIALAEKRTDQPRLPAYMPAKIIVLGKVSGGGLHRQADISCWRLAGH